MSYYINQVTLLGIVDSIYESIHDGNFCLRFSLETQRLAWSPKDGCEKLVKDWHKIALWRDRGLSAKKYLRKGDYVYVIGELTYKIDKNDAKKIWTEVTISDKTGKVMFLGPGLREEDFYVEPNRSSPVIPPIPEKKTPVPLEDKKPYASNAKKSKLTDSVKSPARAILEEDDIPF